MFNMFNKTTFDTSTNTITTTTPEILRLFKTNRYLPDFDSPERRVEEVIRGNNLILFREDTEFGMVKLSYFFLEFYSDKLQLGRIMVESPEDLRNYDRFVTKAVLKIK